MDPVTAPLRLGVATAALTEEGRDRPDEPAPRPDTTWDVLAAAGRTADGTGPRGFDALEVPVALLAGVVDDVRVQVSWPRAASGTSGAAAGLDRYERRVDALLAVGVTPVVTLHHGDLPLAVMLDGGWLDRDTAARFADHAAAVAGRLGDRVRDWVTLVDPFGHAFHGYGVGVDAPGLTLLGGCSAALHHQLLGHGLAVAAVRAAAPAPVRIGMVADHCRVLPARDEEADVAAADWYDTFHQGLLLAALFEGGYPAGFEHLPGHDPAVVHDGDAAVIAAPVDHHGVRIELPRVVAAAPDNPRVHFTMVEERPSFSGDHADDVHHVLTRLAGRYPGVPQWHVEAAVPATAVPAPEPTAAAAEPTTIAAGIAAVLADVSAGVRTARAAGVPVTVLRHGHLVDGWEFGDGFTRPAGLVVGSGTGARVRDEVLAALRSAR